MVIYFKNNIGKKYTIISYTYIIKFICLKLVFILNGFSLVN